MIQFVLLNALKAIILNKFKHKTSEHEAELSNAQNYLNKRLALN